MFPFLMHGPELIIPYTYTTRGPPVHIHKIPHRERGQRIPEKRFCNGSVILNKMRNICLTTGAWMGDNLPWISHRWPLSRTNNSNLGPCFTFSFHSLCYFHDGQSFLKMVPPNIAQQIDILPANNLTRQTLECGPCVNNPL